jgi:phosphonate transport system permease protein
MTETIKPLYKRTRFWLWTVVLLALYIWSFSGIKFEGFSKTSGMIVKAVITGIFHPDWGYVSTPDKEDLIHRLFDTLAISFLATFVSAILCIPFAFLAARNMSKVKGISSFGKFVNSVIRTIPDMIYGIIFIKAVGPGMFAGVLALGIHSIGMLGKLLSEALENMDLGPSEALTACGANRFQTLWFAIVPQILPEFMSYILYRFEINVRSATVLGLIGAGGIGTPLIFALEGLEWSRVGIILLGIIVTVTIIDWLSGYIRKKLV